MVHRQIDLQFAEQEAWALRRQKRIPNNRSLWVLACMDERLPIEAALGIREGDAHVFRNAGGLVTDDALRSAMLTTQFFGTREIIIVNHTECGMMSATGEAVAAALKEKGIDTDNVPIDPDLPELKLAQGAFAKWIKTFQDVDTVCERQIQLLRESPLIPDDVVINGYVWEVENRRLRPPHHRLSSQVNSSREMGTAGG